MSMVTKLSFSAKVGEKGAPRLVIGNTLTEMSIRKMAIRERREGKLFSPRDILAAMVKARGNNRECDQSFILSDI